MTIRIDRVVTRGGDRGETSLGDGTRVDKDCPRIEALGAVDEANATIGMMRVHLAAMPDFDVMAGRIQNDLFDLGADLCVPGEAGARLRMTDRPVARLEAEVLAMNAALPPLTSFVLPGGTAAAAAAHMARTITRRAERRVLALSRIEEVNPAAIRLLNRLSDHLFVLSRVLNSGVEPVWRPGAGLAE
jgi:cob(I)alamin adenosyltransferase